MAVEMAAPPARVFDMVRDVTRWPTLLPHYRQVSVESRAGERVVARMVAVRSFGPLELPVAWRAAHWADPANPDDLRLHFLHLRGPTRGMSVTWHIRPRQGGSLVTIEHDFSRPVPLLGPDLVPRLIDRLFVRPIAGRTLAAFRGLAERDGLP